MKISSRLVYLGESIGETTFTEGASGGVVTSIDVPEVDFESPETGIVFSIDEFVSREYDGVKIDWRGDKALELRSLWNKTKYNNIEFKPKGAPVRRLKPQIVLKCDRSSMTQYNDARGAQEAVSQCETLIEEVIEETKNHAETRVSMPMVETTR